MVLMSRAVKGFTCCRKASAWSLWCSPRVGSKMKVDTTDRLRRFNFKHLGVENILGWMTNRKPGAATIYCPPLGGASTYSLGKRSPVMPDSASINFYTRTCLDCRYWPYPVLFLTDGVQDTHNVRSVAFHPCGDYLLAGFLDTFLYAHFSSKFLLCNLLTISCLKQQAYSISRNSCGFKVIFFLVLFPLSQFGLMPFPGVYHLCDAGLFLCRNRSPNPSFV